MIRKKKRFMPYLLSTAVLASSLAVATPMQASASTSTTYTKLASNIQDGVILHCFDWSYQQIIDELPNIKAAGFTSVQTSPAQQACVSNSIWYYLYQPNTFTVGNSGLGSESDLKRLCSEADKYGIKVIVDVVANHLAGDHSNIDNSLKDSQYWHNGVGNINYSNRYQITHGDIGMPDFNSEHSYVQQKVKNYVQQLKADGVDGIRWDAAKHISLPSESCNFWSTVIDKSMYNYGEILDKPVENNDGYAKSLMSEYTNYMSVTDSIYSGNVLGSLKDGQVCSAYANWATVDGIDNNELVYWGESHDTYSNNTNEGGWTKYINQNVIDRAYATVASRNQITALYFSRPYATEKTSIMVGQKGSTHFTSKEVAAINHLHNACIGEADYYTTSNNVSVITRKSGAALILGSGSNRYVSVPNGGSLTEPGTYVDEISGNKFTVTSSTISGTIGSSGIAAFYKVDNPDIPTPIGESTIYFDPSNCSWYGDDSAVPAIKSNLDSSYTKMTEATVNNKTVYKATVPANATTATIARMVSNGNTYNEVTISLNSSTNYYTADSNLSSVTGSKVDVGGSDVGGGSDTPITDTITVYFSDNMNWGNVYAYSWGGSTTSASWPGDKMTYVSTNEYNQAVYKIEIAKDSTGLIFSNGNGSQTVDITDNLTDGTGFYLTSSGSKCSVGTYTYK